MKNRLLFSVLFIIVSSMGNIYSQWSVDPAVNNPICVNAGSQTNPKIINDGFGGAIITWEDTRNGNYDIYAQRVSTDGGLLWTPSTGVVISDASGNQGNPNIVSDGANGAIITWQDARSGNTDIYAQKINPFGTVQWTSNGVILCNAVNNQNHPNIVSDGSSGAIITWEDYRSGTGNYDVYSQRINSDGTVQWTPNGVAVCNVTNNSQLPTIASVSDGNGGAIVTWIDLRNLNSTSYDLYAQRINADGTMAWTSNGVAICTAINFQDYPTIVSDGYNGAIITWQDERDIAGYFNDDIYAQRINASGFPRWTADGMPVCKIHGDQYVPTIVSADLGAVITWKDFRNGNFDIYAQRVYDNGSTYGVSWTDNGVAICTDAADQQAPIIISNGANGAIIVWKDYRNGNWDIYAQKINSSGVVQWTSNGSPLSNAAGIQEYPAMVADNANGAVVTWQDYRNSNYDIYAYGITIHSPLPVELVSFTAQTGNGIVELNWKTATELNNYGFEIERASASGSLRGQEAFPGNRDLEGYKSIGFVQGNGNSNSPKEYSFTDQAATSGSYAYRLKQLDNDGTFKYSDIVEVTVSQIPNDYSLNQNFPNPFNPTTTLSFAISHSSLVTLKVFDVLGNEIAVLVNENKPAGTYEITFDAKNLPSGIYFYTIRAGEFSQSRKMILMK